MGKINLFLSYTHDDEKYVSDFITHIAPLKNNQEIDYWYDRKLLAGDDLRDEINKEINKADVICLFISAKFLASQECIDEKNKALELRQKKGVRVIPIILSNCGWKDCEDIKNLVALPIDAKPIEDFDNHNNAWNIVYKEIKKIVKEERTILGLNTNSNFLEFLNNVDLLTKSHPGKNKLLLEDIFIYPELEKYDYMGDIEKKISSEELTKNIYYYPKIILTGENQSGRTFLLKKLFIELRNKRFIPIYISDKANKFKGNMENKISEAFSKQYDLKDKIKIEDIDVDKVVILIDDFHLAINQEKHINYLSKYIHQIIVVDDIFYLSFKYKDEEIFKSYAYFRIKELKPSLRSLLIEKWVNLKDSKGNVYYQNIDQYTELVDRVLGKVIGYGIMPAYPFFILSVISTYETLTTYNQEITSQGYCYQAFIYMYLRKQGVKNEDIDTYINFLIEFAFYKYKLQQKEINQSNFDKFMVDYLNKYHLPIKKEILIKNLCETNIIKMDNLGNYFFPYPYIYYFFVAKYFTDHLHNKGLEKLIKEKVDSIISNLHNDENAYIAIFMAHHSKDNYILDEIKLNAMCLFDKFSPAKLDKNELAFFDKQSEIVCKAAISLQDSSQKNRKEILEIQDDYEEKIKKETKIKKDDEATIELRRSIKTVEVMGNILKNRAGSLEKQELESIFKEGLNIFLRILTAFVCFIKDEKQQSEIISFISYMLTKFIENQNKGVSKEKVEKTAKTIFWNLNFFVIYGLINKTIHSLGSEKTTEIIEKVCDNNNSCAALLIKHGILMWYRKNLQTKELIKIYNSEDISKISQDILRGLIANYCSMHKVSFQEKQEIANKFQIQYAKLLNQ